uniref:TIL domain-containing protein n=1 Tax=Steinernema glaseri TaxID=37863 RepID=A0A1I7YUB9_9BILA
MHGERLGADCDIIISSKRARPTRTETGKKEKISLRNEGGSTPSSFDDHRDHHCSSAKYSRMMQVVFDQWCSEKKCGRNEVWDDCPRCLNTCLFRLPEDKCGKKCKPAQCVCQKGYLRVSDGDHDICVLVADCPIVDPTTPAPQRPPPPPSRRN